MKAHQKCFSLTEAANALANRFILVANLEAEDGGKAIVAGNERVIRARLADAKFFYDQDRKTLARRPRGEARRRSSSTRSSAAQDERVAADRGAGARDRAFGRRRSRRRRARRHPRQGRSGHRHGRRVPRAAGRDGPLLRARPGGTPGRSPTPSPTHYKPQGPTDAVPTRSGRRSPWRSPTSSTRWSASGPSTRSRPARRTRTRCAAPRSA